MRENIALDRRADLPLEAAADRPTVSPRCDIYEREDALLLVADLPGVRPEDLHLRVEAGILELSAQRHLSEEGACVEGGLWACDFQRRFSLPGGIDASKIEASLKEGVLSLTLPKAAGLRPREIPVRAL